MKPSLVRLQKYFRLEAERGYVNDAIMGGLDKMLTSWEAEARVDGLDDDLIQAVVVRLRDYHRLSPNSREEALKGLWSRILRSQGLEPPERQPTRPRHDAPPPHEDQPPAAPGTQGEHAAASQPQAEGTQETRPRAMADSQVPARAGSQAAAPERAATEETPVLVDVPLDAEVTVVPGIGPRHAKTLARLGLTTLADMLYYFPRRYDDYSRLKPINRLWYGEEVTVIGTVHSIGVRKIRNGRIKLIEAVVTDGSGGLRVTWFNQPWIADRLRKGTPVVLSGKVEQYLGRLTMNNPQWELLEKENLHTNRIVPVYPLTAKLTQRWLRGMMHRVVRTWAPRVEDPIPASIREEAGLLPLSEALLQAHFPESEERLQLARRTLAFDEIFLLQLGVLRQKRNWQDRPGRRVDAPEEWLVAQIGRLPFELTAAQRAALEDVRSDLASGRPMNRLLQGDVGSGKTVVAGLGIAMVVNAGAQAALMAPTGILAEQHYRNMLALLDGEAGPLDAGEIRLLVGATPEREKGEIKQALADGRVRLVVGTHALLEEPVAFADLGIAIVDEQHRFGVDQRAALRGKGANPHLLVMTATPIPRSLALTVYGDLDLTIMDELPPGRQEVETHILLPLERERAYALIRSQVARGSQAFVIYPLVEESEKSDAPAAVEEFQRLQKEVFPDVRLGLLHGRLPPDEKDRVMTQFRDGEFQVLVATTVIEVGVDVPNATVMLVEGANRFGLAQLHQLRGRVGRGGDQAYCLLIPDKEDAVENERLAVMAATNDGFVLAEKDLEQRGPGEFLGTRQSGFAELQMASLTDVRLIEAARRHAQALFEQSSDLPAPEKDRLTLALDRFWGGVAGDIS